MDEATLRRRAATGVLFLAVRTTITQLCVLGGNVVLARVLSPVEFGVYAILRFALSFFEYFGDAGIGSALVRQQTPPTERQLRSVFTLQFLLSSAVVAVVWVAAPLVDAIWTQLPAGSGWLLRAMSLAFFMTATKVAPAVGLERKLKFAQIAVVEVLQTVTFYGVAVALALSGAGTWAWVVAMVLQALVGLVGAYVVNPWRPRFELDWDELRPLLRFGIPFQLKGFIGFVSGAVAPLYAGATLGPQRLGYINWGQSTAYFPLKLVEVMSRVSFPLFARFQHDPPKLRQSLERSLQVCGAGTFFCIALFSAMATNVTEIIYTAKWLPALFPLHVYAWALAIGFFSPVAGAALDAIGRPDVIARLAVGWTVVNWIVVPITTAKWGLEGFVLGNCVHIVVGNVAAMVAVVKLVPGIRLFRPMVPLVGGAAGAFAVGWLWGRHFATGPAALALAIVVMLVVDLGITAVLDPSLIRDLRATFGKPPPTASAGAELPATDSSS